jgi:(R,R)-butanediol dehydrogenase/meso-butanediol dehydrogenase/diacetyl reductase
MKAVVLRGPGRLEVDTVADPTPEPGQLVLRVSACGICGTDLALVRAGALAPGSVLGHEFCGEVVESGAGFSAGERVCALPALSCGGCARCRSGLGAYCQKQRTVGMGTAPGAFGEYVVVARREVVRLPEELGIRAGALVEPLAVSLHAIRVGRLRRGESCLILGGGPIGLGTAVWARHFGAGEVIVSESNPARRALAEKLGATRAVEPGDALAELLASRLPDGPDVVIEAAGAPGLIQTAMEAVRFRGRVVVAGVCMSPDPIRALPALMGEVTLHFVLAYEKDDFQYTIDMLGAGRIEPLAMVTASVPLDEVPGAFQALSRPCEHAKILFVADASHGR